MGLFKKFILFIALAAMVGYPAQAQEKWASPELERMYSNARQFMAMGNYHEAAITYRQLAALAPGQHFLQKELATAVYRDGDYKNSLELMAKLIDEDKADEDIYQMAAAAHRQLKRLKKAGKLIQKGLAKYPRSGLLYHEQGDLMWALPNVNKALQAYLAGIKQAPAFAANYGDAAKIYLESEDPFWGILMAEVYLNMAHDTSGNSAYKMLLYAALRPYVAMNGLEVDAKSGFKGIVNSIYLSLSPTMSDGNSIENQAMIHTRFLLDWYAKGLDKKMPYSLFEYLDDLTRNGWADIYYEWLYGQAAGKAEYEAWNNFHTGDLERFEAWHQAHPIVPRASDDNGYDREVMFGE